MDSAQHETVIFLHVMKTGGRTLAHILKQNYRNDVRFHRGQRPGETLEALQHLPAEKRRSLKFIHGHMPFGIHTWFEQPCTYITLLRNPIDRVISHYYYALHNPRHYTHQLVTEQNMSLAQYVKQGIIDMNNGQTRAIAGAIGQQFDFGSNDVALLDAARSNLEASFSLVGLTERFDESLVLLRQQLALTHVLYTRANVNRSRPQQNVVSPEDIECIQHYNALDIQLYEDVCHQFQQKINDAGITFQTELSMFKQFNDQYAAVQSDVGQLKQKLSMLRKTLKKAKLSKNRMQRSLHNHRQELTTLMNSRSGKVWKQWDKLKQKIATS